jgi:hypothetical protein
MPPRHLMKTYALAALAIIVVGILIGAALMWYVSHRSSEEIRVSGFDQVTVGAIAIPLNESLSGSYEDTYAKLDFTLPLPETKGLRNSVKDFIFAHLPDPNMYDSTRITAEDREMRNQSAAGQYTYSMKGRIETGEKDRTSYVLEIYEFTGGAHGGYTVIAETYDKNGKAVPLKDVIGGGPNYDRIAAVVRPILTALIQERKGTSYIVEEDFLSGTAPEALNYAQWYVKDDTVVFIFNQYQIGPYVLGMFEVPVSLEALK